MIKLPVLHLARFLNYTVGAALLANVATVLMLPLWLPYLYSEDIITLLYTRAAARPSSGYYGFMIFLAFCGVCTAVILKSAYSVLGRVCRKESFSQKNGAAMQHAGLAALLISAAGLWRVVLGFSMYNVAFTALFLLAGLFCFVFAELFMQAAVLKEDSDLTI